MKAYLRISRCLTPTLITLALHSTYAEAESLIACDVVIVGGSTAALSAALTSAREGAETCLLEPTDWAGGQMTAGGVPAIDFAWHSIGSYRVGEISKQAVNIPAEFRRWLTDLENPGDCSVSPYCFEPKNLLQKHINPTLASTPGLRVFYNTVLKKVSTKSDLRGNKTISSLTAIQRTAKDSGENTRLSSDMKDWYSPEESSRYWKDLLTFQGKDEVDPIVIDASEWGDALVLSGAPYLQGVEILDGSTVPFDESCGQALAFPFVMRRHAAPQGETAPQVTSRHPEFYSFGSYDWNKIWRYRRIKGEGPSSRVGELSLQNWFPGNDYPFRYVFKSRDATTAEIQDWTGGVDYEVLRDAEDHAYGWYYWYKARDPHGSASTLTLDQSILGTTHGLSKFPYLRDTRRSVGLDNFILKAADLSGRSSDLTGKRFLDRIGIGSYAIDIHAMKGCRYANDVYHDLTTLPYYLPLRALTNRDVRNLLVAGKTMAQSFLANAATRLQPVEFSSGIGAGAAAAFMSRQRLQDTEQALAAVSSIQTLIKKYAPLQWTINGVAYPKPGEDLHSTMPKPYCPPGSFHDFGLNFCTDDTHAYGPLSHEMIKTCEAATKDPSCRQALEFSLAGSSPTALERWSKQYAIDLRGPGRCMRGTEADAKYPQYCVEDAAQSASGLKEIYGPFDAPLVNRCLTWGGSQACYSHRWSYDFFLMLKSY
jgi:hypothetical protein